MSDDSSTDEVDNEILVEEITEKVGYEGDASNDYIDQEN